LAKLRKEKTVSDALAGELKSAVTEFKQTFDLGKPKEATKPQEASKEATSNKGK
jgi:hypothetical protein